MSLTFVICVEYVFGANLVHCAKCKKNVLGLSYGLSGGTSIGLSCGLSYGLSCEQHHLSSRIISFQHRKYTIYTERTLISPVQFSVFSITNKEELFGKFEQISADFVAT